jgi:hypothetical protein
LAGFQNQLLNEQMAVMAMGGYVAGFIDELSAEEQAFQQVKQQHSSY